MQSLYHFFHIMCTMHYMSFMSCNQHINNNLYLPLFSNFYIIHDLPFKAKEIHIPAIYNFLTSYSVYYTSLFVFLKHLAAQTTRILKMIQPLQESPIRMHKGLTLLCNRTCHIVFYVPCVTCFSKGF